MTQRPADVPSLPLSVTCTADAAFADTIVALAARMVGATDGAGPAPAGSAARRFADAVREGVAACLAPGAGTVAVALSAEEAHWLGDLRWTPAADTDLARLQTSLAGLADAVECVHDGADARCTIRCRRE